MTHLSAVETSQGDTSIAGHVDLVLVGHVVDLSGGQSGEGEHTNLVGDVAPVLLGVFGVQRGLQLIAHIVNAASHASHLSLQEEGWGKGWVR